MDVILDEVARKGCFSKEACLRWEKRCQPHRHQGGQLQAEEVISERIRRREKEGLTALLLTNLCGSYHQVSARWLADGGWNKRVLWTFRPPEVLMTRGSRLCLTPAWCDLFLSAPLSKCLLSGPFTLTNTLVRGTMLGMPGLKRPIRQVPCHPLGQQIIQYHKKCRDRQQTLSRKQKPPLPPTKKSCKIEPCPEITSSWSIRGCYWSGGMRTGRLWEAWELGHVGRTHRLICCISN